MFTNLVKYSAPLILLFTILSFSGIVPTAISLAGQQTADICCGSDSDEHAFPVETGECAETECRCFSCAVPTLLSCNVEFMNIDPQLSFWSVEQLKPSGHINDIEYPPEFS